MKEYLPDKLKLGMIIASAAVVAGVCRPIEVGSSPEVTIIPSPTSEPTVRPISTITPANIAVRREDKDRGWR